MSLEVTEILRQNQFPLGFKWSKSAEIYSKVFKFSQFIKIDSVLSGKYIEDNNGVNQLCNAVTVLLTDSANVSLKRCVRKTNGI